MRRAVVFNYDSIFAADIEKAIRRYNLRNAEEAFSVDMYRAEECPLESMAGPADVIVHSGGDGAHVKEDTSSIPKLYICHSHQWKAREEGGRVVPLKDFIKGIRLIDILADNKILGRKGKMPIMEYHRLAVVKPPHAARVLATSTVPDASDRETEIIEALRYPDGSLSVQGHPEESTAEHIFYNFFESIKEREKQNETFGRNSKLDKVTG